MYLVVGALAVASTLFMDELWTGLSTAEFSSLIPVTMGIFGLTAAGAIVAIFLYRDRKRQRKIVLVVQYLLLAGMIAFFAGQYLSSAGPFVNPESAGLSTWLAAGLPVAGYLMFTLARRAINRDIELVRSMDRLRS